MPLLQPSLPIHIAPPLLLTCPCLCPLSSVSDQKPVCPVCQQCPHHLNPNPTVSEAQCHPVLYLTSAEDPPPLPPQLPAGSADSLVHNSTHPALDSLPGPVWTSSPSPDCLSSLTFSLVTFCRNIQETSYCAKEILSKHASKIYPHTYTVYDVKFQTLMYPH